MAARALPARPVLPAAEFRDLRRRAVDGHDPRDGRPRADRRLGRPRAGPALDHRAGDGRLVRPLRLAEAGRAGGPDGPDRHADRDPGRRDRAAGRRRARQRRAVLDRRGAARRGLARCSISPATRSIADRYKVEEIEAAADVIVWCCDEAPGFAPDRPQDRTFVGNIVEAMTAYGSRQARAEQAIPLGRRRPHHRHRLGPDDGRGRAGPPRRARAVPEGPVTGRSARSTRRCNA